MYIAQESELLEIPPLLVLVEDAPEATSLAPESVEGPYDYEESNRELLAHLGETSVEEWYKQNGLGYAVPASTYEVATSLVEHWVTLGRAVARGEVVIDGDDLYGDSRL